MNKLILIGSLLALAAIIDYDLSHNVSNSAVEVVAVLEALENCK